MASKLLKSLPRAKADVARALKGRPPLALCGAGPQPALCNSDRVESSRWIARQRIRFGQLRDYHSYEDKAKFGDELLKLHRIHWRLCNSCVFSSQASTKSQEQSAQQKQESVIVTQEDPFDPLTDKIPEKPVTFAEGASYSVIILAGLAVAAGAAYAVCKELIFEPKEYKIFGKTLERVQQDSQVKVRIGSPITGYGQESRNRAARQRIPHRMYTDEDGVERVEVNFYIRGPHGAGKVYSEMFKDKLDKTWKFTYLIVEITSPTKAKLMLESYVPA